MKKLIWTLCWLLAAFYVQAQEELSAEDALQQVFATLTLDEPVIKGDTMALLQRGAWEALSYLDPEAKESVDDLQEAVPDYYHFYSQEVLVKLINPANINEYGVEVRVPFRISASAEIELLKQGQVHQRWQILYLDENYLALVMDNLRVFFTHSPPQE